MLQYTRGLKVSLLPLCGIAILAACGNSSGDKSISSASTPVPLVGRILTDTLTIGLPQTILSYDDILFVLDVSNEQAIAVFDTTGALRSATGSKGAGPGEFVAPRSLVPDKKDSSLAWVFDVRLGRITPVSLSRLRRRATEPPFGDPITLAAPVMHDFPVWIDNSTMVALSPMLKDGVGRFSMFGTSGQLLRTVGGPPPGDAKVPPFVRQQIYGGRLISHPSRPLFAVASRYAPRLEVFNQNGESQVVIESPTPFHPDFTVARDGINVDRGPDFRFGYLDVAVTEDYIYALYSGRNKQDYPDSQNVGEYVHVFTWSGALKRVFRLDTDAFSISVGAAGDKLFAGRLDPYPQIVAYDLRDGSEERR